MRYVDKMVLIPAEEAAQLRSGNANISDSAANIKTVDVGIMTDPVNSKKNMKSVGTMTDEIYESEHNIPTIALLPPGIPKNITKKRKLSSNSMSTFSSDNSANKTGHHKENKKKFIWKEL